MHFECPLRIAEAGFVAGEVPDDDRLVSGRGEDHIGVFRRRGQGGYPAIMA
jgi:hypothetical protein